MAWCSSGLHANATDLGCCIVMSALPYRAIRQDTFALLLMAKMAFGICRFCHMAYARLRIFTDSSPMHDIICCTRSLDSEYMVGRRSTVVHFRLPPADRVPSESSRTHSATHLGPLRPVCKSIGSTMPPKRKSDAFEPLDPPTDQPNASVPVAKKARVSDADEGSPSGAKNGKEAASPPKKWFEVVLEGEEVSRSRNLSLPTHTTVPSSESRVINEVLTMHLRPQRDVPI